MVNDKSIEIRAKTVEEAIEQGLAQLNLMTDDVDIEVINEGKRGVFGLGAEDAIVRLTPKEITPERPVLASEVSDTASSEASQPSDDTLEDPYPEAEVKEPSPEEIAETHLRGLLQRMGINAEVTRVEAHDLVEPGEEPPLVLDISGQDLGILIGRRSETLRALQYMLRLMVSKQISRWYPVVIDVESYRIRRRQSLRQLAEKMAKKAVTSGRKVVLEAMPAYERRIVHIALRDHPDVYTKSVGSDDNRKVTIIPKK